MALLSLNKRNRGELARLHNEMDDLFDGFFRGLDRPFGGYNAWPTIDVVEQDDAVMVRAEVPGRKADDIDISVCNNTLTISGEKRETKEEKDKGYYYSESSYGFFRRDVTPHAEVDANKVEASCKDGVLSITLPKAARSKAVKVQIKG